MIKNHFFGLLCILFFTNVMAQSPQVLSSADILQQIKKLEVFGSVLYVAAHPDDENTRLLGYLANERKFRTGYLSLTRGDGGQNLIGDEQGIDLGLIRTQELLSARRIDGAEQFFTRAFDFGYSKNPEEAMKIWNHDKILADVVWVIRKFKPDVIITRFPTTGEGGHGHHTASAILAGEAFDAAADSTKFKEQLQFVDVWQAKRLLWNTFNFGGNNTQRENQFKIDCGVYNPILGKSYGEIAAESRSRHKSQGFGVPAQRGKNIEYLSTLKGVKPVNDLMDGVDITSKRMGADLAASFENLQKKYAIDNPAASLQNLLEIVEKFEKMEKGYWKEVKTKALLDIIEKAAGLFLEVVSTTQLVSIGDSMKLNFTINNRAGIDVKNATIHYNDTYTVLPAPANENSLHSVSFLVPKESPVSQPYWLEHQKLNGSFEVMDQLMIGKPDNNPATIDFSLNIEGKTLVFKKPVVYKYTDPVKGELYEPIQLVSPVFINVTPNLLIFSNDKKAEKKTVQYEVQSNLPLNEKLQFYSTIDKKRKIIYDSILTLKKTAKVNITATFNGNDFANNSVTSIGGELAAASMNEHQYTSLKKISYDHIPNIFYNYQDRVKLLKMDLKTAGSTAGYIAGAGDKVPQALEQMGYKVTMLAENDINLANLKQFDVVLTGVRAYNIHEWLSNVYPILMQYVKEGGVLFTQYNTNNSIGPVKANIAPYPFTISRNRITDETAEVKFLLPAHPALNFPNKITPKDFEGWIQERSIYNAEKVDTAYKKILSMQDPGETEQDGSLIIADYGTGRFIYTGLVFFRELPAGVPGAYRLFANLIANKK